MESPIELGVQADWGVSRSIPENSDGNSHRAFCSECLAYPAGCDSVGVGVLE